MCSVSVIIVTWNGKQFLRECLDSVLAQEYSDFEVIVVDNGSSDGSVAFIEENYPDVVLLPLEENRGFTGGNIAGYRVAKGKYVALLNNDTRVETLWLKRLVTPMINDDEIGICSSKIFIDKTEMLDSAGDVITTAFSGTKVGYGLPASGFDGKLELHGGCAAAVLYRKRMIEEIGFFDDSFFFNHEDTDLNLRAWLSGWKCAYVPDAVVYHKVSASIGVLSANTIYFFSRNSFWVYIKNVPFSLMLITLPQRILYEIASFVYYCILHGHWGPYLRGKYDAIVGMPRIWGKREFVLSKRRLTNKQIISGLMPISKYLYGRFKSEHKRQ